MGRKDREMTANVIEGSAGIRVGENATAENLLNMFIQEGSSKLAVATQQQEKQQARAEDIVLPSAGILVQSPARTPSTRPVARVAIEAESVDPRHQVVDRPALRAGSGSGAGVPNA